MEKDDFSMEKENTSSNNEYARCALAHIPAETWKNLFHIPFRRRHPWIFWGIFILILVILFFIIKNSFSRDEVLTSEPSLALVKIQGPILDAGSTLNWIRKLENSSSIKGILVRVDSPGGGAAASQEIYAALFRVGQKIPVVISMGATAASGGFMISMAGERIFANPSTVTGSIGVRMDIPQLQGLMSKLGIGQETLVTAPFKDAASYLHPLTPEDRAYLENVIMNMHEQFVGIVAKGRKISREKAARFANGKIYTGQQALELGLVDEMGGEYEALEWLSRKTGVPVDKKLVTRPRKRESILTGILAMLIDFLPGLDNLHNLSMETPVPPVFLYQWKTGK